MTRETEIDVGVVGGGVVGLASALAIAKRGQPVCLVERHGRLWHETSTRNSGVIHADIYYPKRHSLSNSCIPEHLNA